MNYSPGIRMPGYRLAAGEASARGSPRLKTTALVLFVALHAPLGIALKLVPYLSTLHALVSLAIALMLVVRRYPVGLVVAGCAYLVGSEALWRMTDAKVFWEFGKYALLLVVVVALALRRQRVTSYLPVLYLLLLLPGALLTIIIANTSFGNLWQILSFELSGPVAYAACSLFLFGRSLSREEVLRCLAAMLAPIASVAALTIKVLFLVTVKYWMPAVGARLIRMLPSTVRSADDQFSPDCNV